MNPWLILGLMVPLTLVAAVAAFFLKKGAANFKIFKPRSWFEKNLWIGGILYLTDTAAYLYLLSQAEVSWLYPVSSLSYAWSLLLGWKLLNERISKNAVRGVTLIIIGVALISL